MLVILHVSTVLDAEGIPRTVTIGVLTFWDLSKGTNLIVQLGLFAEEGEVNGEPQVWGS